MVKLKDIRINRFCEALNACDNYKLHKKYGRGWKKIFNQLPEDWLDVGMQNIKRTKLSRSELVSFLQDQDVSIYNAEGKKADWYNVKKDIELVYNKNLPMLKAILEVKRAMSKAAKIMNKTQEYCTADRMWKYLFDVTGV